MRHRKKGNHLSRTSAHRKAMMANMASSLILQKRITTTTAKAKALRIFVEPLITRSRDDSTHSRRTAFRYLRDKYAVSELFREVAVKVGDRPGGYTRIIKTGNRQGDNADMCIIELVDYNENLLAEKAAAKPRSGRRRRGGKKKQQATPAVQPEAMTDKPESSESTEEPEGKAEPESGKEDGTDQKPEAKAEPESGEQIQGEEEAGQTSQSGESPQGNEPEPENKEEEKE